MVASQVRGNKRKGGTLVEVVMVLIPLMFFVGGVFEYGRFLMSLNVLNNAAREGCRFALANNTDPTISTDVTTTVTNFMAGQNNNFSNFTVTVSGTHGGTTYTGGGGTTGTPSGGVNNLVAGDLITVTVSGNYQFLNIFPLLHLPASTPISSSVVMVCEGAM